jgi:cytochrome c554/c'-like protein
MTARARLASTCASALLACASWAGAQTFVGSAGCIDCHDPEAARKLKTFHGASLTRVDEKDGPKWAAALKVPTRSPACLKCHGPDEVAQPQAVSCETCHGAASAYDRPHRHPGFYAGVDEWKDRKAGLVNFFERPRAIAEACLRCHVFGADDRALLRAGHPDDAAFDLAVALRQIDHFDDPGVKTRKRDYYPAFAQQVAASGAPVIQARRQAASGKPAPSPLPMVLRPDPPALVTLPAPPRPRPPSRIPSPPATSPASPVADPVRATASRTAGPRSAAELRGAMIRRLTERVRQGKALGPGAPPSPPAAFDGTDGELLAIQDEAMCLALEVLSGQRCPDR